MTYHDTVNGRNPAPVTRCHDGSHIAFRVHASIMVQTFFISRLSTQHINIPSRELTCPTLGKGTSSSKVPLGWDMLVPSGYFTMSLRSERKNISSSGSREPNVHHLNQHTSLLQPKSHLQCFYTAFLRKKLWEPPSGGSQVPRFIFRGCSLFP